MQSYLVEELNKAKARIKELESALSKARGVFEIAENSIAELEERERELLRVIGDRERDNEHLEAELKAVKYCAHCHEAQTDVCPAIKKDQGASE